MKYEKLKVKIFWIAGILFMGIFMFRAGMSAGAASSQPGSVGDPLITKSYLEKRLSEIQSNTSSYIKVSVAKGKTITASAGTELILYSGSGTVIGSNGLLNLSSGELFKQGTILALYSIYFSPSNSSGMKATSNMVLYVKGKYSVK